MKLLKTILPIATISSVAIGVAPLITSCNPQHEQEVSTFWSWDGESERTVFEPTVEPAPEHDVPKESACEILTNEYFNDLKKAPLIFAEDLLRAFSEYSGPQTITYYIKFIVKSFKLDQAIDNIATDTMRTIIRCDFDVIWTAEFDFKSPSMLLLKGGIENRTFSFVNYPILIGGGEEPMELRHLTDFSTKDKKWSIRMPKVIKTYGEPKYVFFSPDEDFTYTQSVISQEDKDFQDFFGPFIGLCFAGIHYPYHLQNINITE